MAAVLASEPSGLDVSKMSALMRPPSQWTALSSWRVVGEIAEDDSLALVVSQGGGRALEAGVNVLIHFCER